MVIGVGTDILHMETLNQRFLQPEDPFFRSTYTPEEAKQGSERENPHVYYCMRFAGKEAVFKSLNVQPDQLRQWNQIEILSGENGAPVVKLHGDLKKAAEEQGISQFRLSLSCDRDYALAFCVASV